jgi:SNF2 family DNA or RNA helicase
MDHSNIYPFKTKPYAHQAKAWDMSKEKDEFGLFMEMGTGKTKVAIDTIAYLYDSGRINSVLIVAPKGVYMNWVTKEIPTHLPDHVRYIMASWHAAPKKAEQEALDHVMSQSDDLRILVMNVEAFSTERGTKFASLFMDIGGRVAMVVDESTAIKNPAAARTKNVIKVGMKAKYKRILTGTPVTRSPLDLYSQCQFLNPHLLGFSSYYTFRNRYAIMVEIKAGNRSFKKIVGFKQLDELTKLLQRFSYRVKKADCLDLPDKVYQYRYVELSKEQKQIYKQLSDTAIASLQGDYCGQRPDRDSAVASDHVRSFQVR